MSGLFSRMSRLTDSLAAINAPVSNDYQVTILLLSLPGSYKSVVSTLMARGDDLQLKDVQHQLELEEEMRITMNDRGSQRPQNERALRAESNKRTRKPVVCFRCGKEGHFKRDCRELEKEKPSSGVYADRFRKKHEAKAAKEVGSSFLNDSESDSESRDKPVKNSIFVVTSRDQSNELSWIVDSGATSHMTCLRELLGDYQEFDTPEKVSLGDGRTLNALGKGTAKVTVQLRKQETSSVILKEVLFVPKLRCSLLSVRAATAQGKLITFGHSRCWFKNSAGKVLAMGSLVGKMYRLDAVVNAPDHAAHVADAHSNNLNAWHRRMGHLNEGQLREMISKKLATGMRKVSGSSLDFCEACARAKQARKAFQPVGGIKSSKRLQLIHSDVCGPMPKTSLGGARYFVTYCDDYTRVVYVYFVKKKSEVFSTFKEFEKLVTTSVGEPIRVLRTDNGGEYTSEEFERYLKERGIRHETCCPYSPEQNGVAERMNRTLCESARAMLSHANLEQGYWAEAISYAAYIRNRCVTSATGVTPFERWHSSKPDLSNIRVFGCVAYAHIPEEKRRKFDSKSQKLRFVGYSPTQKGYRLYDAASNRLVTRRDVIFNEDDFGENRSYIPDGDDFEVDPACAEPVQENEDLSESLYEHAAPDTKQVDAELTRSGERRDIPEDDLPIALRKGKRNLKPVNRCGEECGMAEHYAFCAERINEPMSFRDAVQCEQRAQWKHAVDAEFASPTKNQTWDLRAVAPKHRQMSHSSAERAHREGCASEATKRSAELASKPKSPPLPNQGGSANDDVFASHDEREKPSSVRKRIASNWSSAESSPRTTGTSKKTSTPRPALPPPPSTTSYWRQQRDQLRLQRDRSHDGVFSRDEVAAIWHLNKRQSSRGEVTNVTRL